MSNAQTWAIEPWSRVDSLFNHTFSPKVLQSTFSRRVSHCPKTVRYHARTERAHKVPLAMPYMRLPVLFHNILLLLLLLLPSTLPNTPNISALHPLKQRSETPTPTPGPTTGKHLTARNHHASSSTQHHHQHLGPSRRGQQIRLLLPPRHLRRAPISRTLAAIMPPILAPRRPTLSRNPRAPTHRLRRLRCFRFCFCFRRQSSQNFRRSGRKARARTRRRRTGCHHRVAEARPGPSTGGALAGRNDGALWGLCGPAVAEAAGAAGGGGLGRGEKWWTGMGDSEEMIEMRRVG